MNKSALGCSLFLLMCCHSSQANLPSSRPTPPTKPYVWASWLTKEENTWLKENAIVQGSQVSVSLGDQCCDDHWKNEMLVLLFRRYQQANLFRITYEFEAFGSTSAFEVEWNPATGTSRGIDCASSPNGKLTQPLTREQMREIVAGRLTFEQVQDPTYKPK